MKIPETIHLIQCPVPYALKNVNCYLFETGKGWSLIDTGCSTQETREFWNKTFETYGISKGQLTDIYVTHFHPDHLGSAGWLQQEHGARVHMYGPDREWSLYQWGEEGNVEQANLLHKLYLQNNCPQDIAETVRNQFIEQRNDLLPLPEETVDLHPGDKLEIGNSSFEVLWLPGHCDTMIGFWDEQQKILISADSILPHITPNVGLWPKMRVNPMQDFLETLQKIKELNPKLTLPGHGQVMENTAERAQFIINHHISRLQMIHDLIKSGLETGFDVAREYFELKVLNAHQVRFALSETLAHIEYLVYEGKVMKEESEAIRYSACVTKGGV